MPNPVIIVAGSGMWGGIFEEMKLHLSAVLPKEKIFIVPLTILDWVGFPPSPERSTNRVMQRLHQTVLQAQQRFPNEPLTIIGHSGGGTAAMIYLLGKPFQGDAYPRTAVTKLITLGSPFHSIERYGKVKSDFIFAHLRREFFSQVEVISIASKTRFGNLQGSIAERSAFEFYKNTGGTGSVWGDGVVPVECCQLDGAQNVVLEGIEHLPTPFGSWYGARRGVEAWQAFLN
ncbi:MAG: alpha/beta hydrolase [Chloroherpetonaceae bacterium]|nr:alpha/beta hydrolase [Chloroherpetonaceae bacterium]MCS7210316.1 alpha/beta hydrolase [Chloroherpetonaceae bacterium]MDW8467392.1 alpha/beta hydrolase [Chloroherpetonaceae bacterium]